jgi:hypothetical protein
MATQTQIRAHLAAGYDQPLRRHRFLATDLANHTADAGSPITDSPQTENPEIGFVSQPRVRAPELASFRIPPRRPRRCQPPPPRYTVNSDSNSPHAHG